MKKIFVYFALALALIACNKEETTNQNGVEEAQTTEVKMKVVYTESGQLETKTVYNEGYKFAWNKDDFFYALCKSSEGKFAFYKFTLSEEKTTGFIDGETNKAIFRGEIPENYEISKNEGEILGVFGVAESLEVPTTEFESYDAAIAAVKYKFTTEIQVEFDQLGTALDNGYQPLPIKNIPMVATGLNDSKGYSFVPAVGFIRFAYEAVPYDAIGLRLTVTGKKMSGEFGITSDSPYIALENSGSNDYVMQVKWGEGAIGDNAPDVYFYIPVPVGTYDTEMEVTFTKVDKENIVPYSTKATKTRTGKSFEVAAGHIKPFSPFKEPQYNFTVKSSVEGAFNVGYLDTKNKFYTFRNGDQFGDGDPNDWGGQSNNYHYQSSDNHKSLFYKFVPYTFSGWQDTPVTLMARYVATHPAGYELYFTDADGNTYVLSKNDAHAELSLVFVKTDDYIMSHSILFNVDSQGRLSYAINSHNLGDKVKTGTCYLYFDTDPDSWEVSLENPSNYTIKDTQELVYVYGITEADDN